MPLIDMSGVSEARGYELPATIGSGTRNVEIHRYASSMQARGVGDAEILDACLRANESRCDPPLPEWEVRSCVRSALGYAKGPAGGRVGGAVAPPLPMREPGRVSGAGRPQDLPDLSGMAPDEQARAWLLACFHEDDVACLVRDFRDQSRASQVTYLVGTLADASNGILRRLLGGAGDGGAWATANPLRTLSSRRRDSEVGRLALVRDEPYAVALPGGGGGTARRCAFAEAPAYHHALVECDELPPDEQLERICALFLHGEPEGHGRPGLDAIAWSGGKSYHAMVRIGARDRDDYDDKVRWLYAYCDANGLPVDHHCGNPSRLTRLPGARRGESVQRLVWCRGL